MFVILHLIKGGLKVDIAHKRTDREIKKLEKELDILYKRTSNEITKQLKAKYKQLQKNDTAEVRKQIKHLEDTLKRITIEQENTNKIAMDMLEGELERITDINSQYTYNFIIDEMARQGITVTFGAMNTDTLKYIMKGDKYKEQAINRFTSDKRIIREFKRAMNQSYILGESEQQAMRRIRKIIDMELYESKRIVRTENTKAQSLARDASIRDAINLGIKTKKEWRSCGDSRVRPTHQRLNGEIVEYDKEFSNGCTFPAIDGPASEVVMCRCTFVPVLEGFGFDE